MSESVSSITLPEVKVSKELNYSAALINRPKYRFQRILPQSGSQNSALSQGLEIIFELPPQTVYNLANTILSFTFTPLAGGANSTNWIFRDTIPFFDQIQLYNRSGVYLCDLRDAPNYIKMTNKAYTKFTDFMSNSPEEGLYAPAHSGIPGGDNVYLAAGAVGASTVVLSASTVANAGNVTVPVFTATSQNYGALVSYGVTNYPKNYSGSVALGVGGAAAGQQFGMDGVQGQTLVVGQFGDATTLDPSQHVMAINVTSPAYLSPGGVNTATPVLNYKLKLGQILPDTIFSVDKDLFLNEIMILRLVCSDIRRCGWTSALALGAAGSSQTDPIGGMGAPYGAMSAAATAAPSLNYLGATNGTTSGLSNITIYLATETNQDIVNSIRAKASSKMDVLIPYPQAQKSPLTNVSQTVSYRLNRGHGRRVRRVLWSPFNNNSPQGGFFSFDINNLDYLDTAAGAVAGANGVSKVASFYTMINNRKTCDFDYDCAEGKDLEYMVNESLIRGSVLQNKHMYKYNFCFVEDFTAVERLCDKEDENNLAVGISLDDELKWELYATTVGAGIPLIHQVYAICDKVVTISPAGLTCD